MRPTHFLIKYTLHGVERQSYLRAEAMNDSFAWHMAAIDAGLAPIPKYRIDRSPPCD
ncbi:DUF6555 family protein [Pseudomonas marginalis]|uniref:DUF6555 family protein n=1 Tax=Pseudomonas marginalis TaxID=298 RepID=UPI003CCABBD4